MENTKGTKIMAIAALVVGVVGLSIGFAAFSNTLTISSSATVTPDSDTFSIVATSTGCEGSVTSATGNAGTISRDEETGETTISGVTAAFTEPNQTVTCTYTITNNGQYDAYLSYLRFAEATNNGLVSCAASTGSQANEGLVNSACEGITVTATLGGDNVASTGTVLSNPASVSNTLTKAGGSTTLTLVFAYAENSARADGAFNVTIPDLEFEYASV